MSGTAELWEALRSGDEERIGAAQDQLGGDAGPSALATVAGWMGAEPTPVAVRAGEVVRDLAAVLPAEPAVAPLAAAAAHADVAVRRAAWEAFDEVVRHVDEETWNGSIAPLLAEADPAHTLGAVRAAAKRDFPVTPALAGLVRLAAGGARDERVAAQSLLARIGASDLRTVLADLRGLVAGADGPVDPGLAEALARAELAGDDFAALDGLLAHPAPEVERAARSVAGELLDDATARARAAGDAATLRDLLAARRRLRP